MDARSITPSVTLTIRIPLTPARILLRRTVRRCAQTLTRDTADRVGRGLRSAAAIGVLDPIKGEALVCFCVLKNKSLGGDELAAELRKRIATQLGKALAPKAVKFVSDLLKTRNAKLIR